MGRWERRRTRAAQVFICCTIVTAGSVAEGANDTWNTASNGVWTANSSWTDNSVPTGSDEATFNLAGTYAATLQSNPSAIQNLTVIGVGTNARLQSNSLGPWDLNVTSAGGGQDLLVTAGAAFTVGGTSPFQVSAANIFVGDDVRVDQSSNLFLTAVSQIVSLDLFVSGGATVGVFDGSTLRADGTGTIGSGTDSLGNLNVTGGGDAYLGAARIGDAGGFGYVTVIGAGSILVGTGTSFDVGHSGTGSIVVQSGGELTSLQSSQALSHIGTNSGAAGGVYVDGANSRWINHGVHVGHSGNGQLNLLNNAVVNSIGTSTSVVGFNAGSTGTVTVDGAGTLWRVSPALVVANAGSTGTLTVTNGGTVHVDGSFSVNGNDGSVIVADAGSLLEAVGGVTVSGLGSGPGASLRVQAGGTLTSNLGFIGNFGSGNVTITGAGSIWNLVGDVAMSQGGISNGTLDILDSGTVTVGGHITAGTGTSTLTLEGGMLDMSGGDIGGGGGSMLVDNLNFRSGTLMNVAQINNGVTPLVKTTAGTLTLEGTHTFTGGIVVEAGTLNVRRLQPNNPVTVNAGLLKVLESAPTLPSHPAGNNASVSRPSSLTIAAGARLDLTNNDLIIDYTGATPIATYEALIASGYNVTGDWQGDGITSSVAAQDGSYVLAVADNATLAAPFGTAQGGPFFAGVDVDLTTVLVKFTHRVDINLDGVITSDDGAIFGSNYSENDPAYWSIGDMDYDGVFTPTDAAIFGTFYDESLASLPEPATVGLLAVAGALCIRRRPRG